MSDQSAAAVAESPPSETQQEKRPSKTKPKVQPPYAVIVHNDDQHTFEYVIDTFAKVFGYPFEKGFLLANQIHTEGKAIVWSGTLEVAELKRDQIRSAGPDFFASEKVDFPLSVTVEPLP